MRDRSEPCFSYYYMNKWSFCYLKSAVNLEVHLNAVSIMKYYFFLAIVVVIKAWRMFGIWFGISNWSEMVVCCLLTWGLPSDGRVLRLVKEVHWRTMISVFNFLAKKKRLKMKFRVVDWKKKKEIKRRKWRESVERKGKKWRRRK